MAVDGQVSPREIGKLIELGSAVEREKVIVGIGTYRGRSAIALAFGSRLGSGGRVYAIDPHLPSRGMLGGKFGPVDQAVLYRNLVKARVADLVFVVSLRFAGAARAWSEANARLLFIDGDHRYEGVRDDFDVWYPLVMRGGTVVFHDSSTRDVERVIEEALEAGKLIPLGRIEELSWFRKI